MPRLQCSRLAVTADKSALLAPFLYRKTDRNRGSVYYNGSRNCMSAFEYENDANAEPTGATPGHLRKRTPRRPKLRYKSMRECFDLILDTVWESAGLPKQNLLCVPLIVDLPRLTYCTVFDCLNLHSHKESKLSPSFVRNQQDGPHAGRVFSTDVVCL